MSMFIKGALCELRALEESDEEARIWTQAVNAGLTTKHMLTGSIPMRAIDCKEVWKKEREAGSVQFGIWTKHPCEALRAQFEPPFTFIGTCGLYAHRDIYRSWEFRILIFDPDAIGKGIGTEATKLTISYCFDRLNAHRCWLGVSEANQGAIHCYEKAGFRREGVLRDEIFTFGTYHNAIRMGILENDYKEMLQMRKEKTGA